MIRESQPHSNDDDAFDALIKNTWETEPSLRDTIDPGILRLIHDAKSAEDALNFATNPSEDTIQEVLLNLNGDWDMLGFRDEAIKVTGRLRPTEYALDENVVDDAHEGAFPGIGERKEDLLGEYFDAAGFRAIVKGFDVERVPMGEYGSMYRVVMQYGLDEDYEDGQVWFTSRPDDIEYMEPHQPSREGAEEFVRANFPEVFAAVQALPDGCRDPELIRQLLDDFSVTFDVSKADTTMGDDEVLDLIETYITDRLAFDNATYDAVVRGVIYGRTMTYAKVPKEYDGTLRELLISNVRLFPTPDTAEGQTLITYRPTLETWYLVPEAQGGRTPIYIPIDSLTRLTANRPETSAYPFDEDTIIQPNEQFDSNFGVRPLEQRLGEAVIDAASMTSVEHADEASDRDGEQDIPEDEKERQRQFLAELHGLHEIVRQYASSEAERPYPSKAAIADDYEMINYRISAFFQRWQTDMNPVIEVIGPALRIPEATFSRVIDQESQTLDIQVKGFGVSSPDVFSSAKGILAEANVQTRSYGEDDEQHVIRAYLEFIDLGHGNNTITITDPDTNASMVTINAARRFVVDLGLPAGYSLPSLDYDARRSEALARTAKLDIAQSSRQMLQKNLEYLAGAIDSEPQTEMTEFDGVEGLRDIALAFHDNPSAMDVAADALEAILGAGRTLRIAGPFIDDSAKHILGQEILATLDGVVTEHPFLKTSEIALVMRVPTPERNDVVARYVVPLSTLEEMAF